MQSLWHWLTDQWREPQAVTLQAPSHRAHPQVYTPIVGITEAASLRWLIGQRRR